MNNIEMFVKKIIAEIPGVPGRDLGKGEVTNDLKLDVDLGLDAVDAVDLVRSLGTRSVLRFQLKLPKMSLIASLPLLMLLAS